MRSQKVTLWLLGATLAAVSGCSASHSEDTQLATVTMLNTQQKSELENTIGQWFNGIPVTVADNVFTETSSVTIERSALRDSRGLPVEGRHSNKAYVFTLYKRGTQCFLKLQDEDKLVLLAGIKCVANQ